MCYALTWLLLSLRNKFLLFLYIEIETFDIWILSVVFWCEEKYIYWLCLFIEPIFEGMMHNKVLPLLT